ncbi:glycerate kinase [Kitasatospora sp. YST-16]|uniref:glycerate kinase n=1 Tax=unclassified Kitasatospora TaxID=2633591 RepID=UPI0005642436|nr:MULTISPECIES: glycerate kinase [unclassified Kitasatospora]WAL74768.1 glycerate kinase [Kitasatospora sp. YST-16]WNW40822.1 glycerate kinase [Streptomyces sp. Li-HN-5-13]
MRVVIAPDSFKGTVTAADAARALAEGWHSVRPDDRLALRPMADGGEGTLAAVTAAHPGAATVRVGGRTGPDGRPVDGAYALLPDGTAVVELATASGLPLLDGRPAPLTATTRGTGELVAAALDAGATRLLLGLGGSATTDGGTGLLAALGLRLLDADGRLLPDGGGALVRAHRVDRTRLRPAPPRGVELLTDVTNPLLGPDGAATVYGPQKGAGPTETARLEAGLARLAELLGGDPGQAGAGAAGGTAYGLTAAWGATTTPGATAVADLLHLDEAIGRADLVITGEGRFDATSLRGKAVGEVLARAARAGVPAQVVAGESPDPTTLTLTTLAGNPRTARTAAPHWLRRAGAHLAATHRNTVAHWSA